MKPERLGMWQEIVDRASIRKTKLYSGLENRFFLWLLNGLGLSKGMNYRHMDTHKLEWGGLGSLMMKS